MGRANRHDDELRRRFEDLVMGSPGSVWLKTSDWRFLAVSPTFSHKLGLAPDDLGRSRDADLIPAFDVARFRADDLRALRQRRPVLAIEPPDSVDSAGWFVTLKVPLFASSGRPAATVAASFSLDALVPLEELLYATCGEEAAARSWQERLQRHLDAAFFERMRVASLAALIDRHPDHLARTFRRRLGTTIAQYVRARRVAYAARRLVATDEPVAEVALAAGFFDQPHLTRSFRELLGTAPARYRRLARHGATSTTDPSRRATALLALAASGGLPARRPGRPAGGE